MYKNECIQHKWYDKLGRNPDWRFVMTNYVCISENNTEILVATSRLTPYIHNWSFQRFKQDYWPSFWHHLCCVCVLILYKSGGNYSLKLTPNDRCFEKLFMAILFTFRVFARNLLRERKSPKKYVFVFCFDVWPGLKLWLLV